MNVSSPTRTSVAAALLAVAVGCFSPPSREVHLRPLTIRVVDATTGRPLAGVPVSYALQTIVERGRLFGVVPSLEADIGPALAFKRASVTSGDGEVSFDTTGLVLPGDQRLDQEYVFVNLEVDLGQPAARRWLETAAEVCAAWPRRCAGRADSVDVAFWMHHASADDRAAVFRNPVEGRAGALLVTASGTPPGAYRDWTTDADAFRVRFLVSSRERAESATVELAEHTERHPPRENHETAK